MRGITLWLLLSATVSAQTRYARLGEIDGSAEMQIHPAEPWKPGLRNTPLRESSWVRTGGASHAEIELDEGSVLRLADNSVCELADYTRLSTGQRITHISLDRGIAYFSGESNWRDALILSMPSAQVSIRRGSRVRLEAGVDFSQLAVLEGEVRFSSAAIELDVPEGKMLKIDPARSDKFYLLPEVAPLDSDAWSLTRDKLLVGDASRNRLPGLHYGLRDLDAHGEWIDTAEFGIAWKPNAGEGWARADVCAGSMVAPRSASSVPRAKAPANPCQLVHSEGPNRRQGPPARCPADYSFGSQITSSCVKA